MPRGLSERAHQKVLAAAAELFATRGIDATSMDAIAAAASVSKATVYKHWADKDALCLEVLLWVHRQNEEAAVPDSGNLREDMKAFLAYEPAAADASLRRRLAPHLIAYSARNPEFGRAWKTRVMEPVRAGIRKLLKRGVEAGIFSIVLDEDLSVTLLLGPMIYRHMLEPAVDLRWLAEGVVESFWKAQARTVGEKAVPVAKRAATAAKAAAVKAAAANPTAARLTPSRLTPSRLAAPGPTAPRPTAVKPALAASTTAKPRGRAGSRDARSTGPKRTA